MPDRTSAPMSSLPAASTQGGTIPNGITAACQTRRASRSAVRVMSTKSPPPAYFWSATTAASSPGRPSTSTAASAFTELAGTAAVQTDGHTYGYDDGCELV